MGLLPRIAIILQMVFLLGILFALTGFSTAVALSERAPSRLNRRRGQMANSLFFCSDSAQRVESGP